jgi:hypothetical protein
MAICHALDHKAAELAVECGVDGLIHVWYDVDSAPKVIEKIVKAGIWVTTTIVTLGALAGEITGGNLVNDKAAMGDLPEALHNNISCCWIPHRCVNLPCSIEVVFLTGECNGRREPASTANAIAITRALHKAGVPILAGTDACGIIGLGAVYGVSFHGELRYLGPFSLG